MAYAGVKITANSSDYQAQMKSAANAMKVLSAEYTSAAAQAKAYGKETDGLKAKAESLTQKITVQSKIVQMNGEQQERLTQKLSEQKDEQEKLKAKIDDARSAYEKSEKETGKNSEQTKALAKELDDLEQQYKLNETAIGRTETALANQTVKTEKSKASLTDMEGELKKVNKELKNHKWNTFADGCEKAGEKIEKTGKKVSKVSAAVTVAGVAAGKMAVDFEDDMAKVSTIMDTNEMSVSDMKDAIIDLSNETGIAVGNVADDVYNAISAGQKTGDAVSFVSSSTKLATAGFAESGDTLNILTTILNAYRLKATEVTNVSDMLIQTQNLGKTTVAELSSAMGKVIPTANANHVALDQLCSGYAIMTANGVATAESTTYMNSMLNELGKTGSTTDVILRQKTGKSFSELMKGGSSLADVLKIVQDAAKDDNKTLNDMFSSSEAAKAGVILLGDGSKKFNSTLKQMQQSTGATDTAFNKMKTTSHSAKIAVNEMKNSALKLGTTMLNSASPSIEKGTKKIHELTQKFNSLNDKQQQTVIKVGLVLAAMGPATVAVGKMAKGVGATVKGVQKGIEVGGKVVSTVKNVIAKIVAKTAATAAGTAADTAGTAATAAHTAATTAATATTGGMTAAQTALNLAMSLCPIVLIVGLIAGLIAAGVALYKNWDKISSGAKKLWGNAKETFSNMRKSAKENFDKVAESAKQGFKNAGNEIKNSKVGKAAQDIFKKVSSTVSSNMKEAVGYARKNLGDIKDAYKEHGGGITGIVAASMTAVKKKYQLGYDVINKLTGGKLDTMVQKTREGFKKAVSSIAEKISDAKANATKFATGVMDSIKSIPSEAKDIGKNLVTGLWNGISNMSKWVTSKIKGFGDGILSDLKSFFGIHSPSKVMEEQIGKNLALGVAQGITKNQKNAKKSASEMGELIVKAATTKLKTYQTYHKMSIKQETEYWNTIRKECKKGTAARTEADKKYLADKKSLNSQMLKAQKEYAKQEKEINKDLKAQIKSLNDEYKNAVKERKNSILSSFSLFESYNAGESVSKSDLLVGMQMQVEALDEWTRQIATLKSRIGGTALFSAVQDMGVDALQQVKAMNSMSDEELQRYRKMYNQRQSTAKNEATTELTSKKESTDSQIQKATESAQKKIETAQKSYAKTLKSLGIDTKTTSKLIAQTEKPLVKSFKNIGTQATKSMKSAVSTTKKGVESLKKATTFNWSLPKLKLPHLSVSAGKSPYGIDGNGSLPKFSAEYYKNGAVMTKPTVFGLHKDRFMIGGEAGDEAILPLRAFYQNLNAMLDNKIAAAQNLQPVYVTNYTYLDGDEIASRTVTKVDRSMVKDKKKRR
jgi:TP901 family phage tail tape measure protein